MRKEQGPVGRLGQSKKVSIIGGGVSGLLMGYFLKKAGLEITIYEKSSIGGKISTQMTTSGPVESAANAIFTNSDVIELLRELNLEWLPANKPLKKKIWRSGKARGFPLSFAQILRFIAGLLKPLPKNKKDVSVYDFFSPLLGEKAAFELLSSVLGGIYASNSKELHFASIFKLDGKARTYFGWLRSMIASKKKSGHRPSSVSFQAGMQTFIDALRGQLKEHIIKQEALSIREFENVIICTDAMDAAQLLDEVNPKLSKALSKISYKALSTGTYFTKGCAKELDRTFGILFPPGSGFKCLGILNNSAIFPARYIKNGNSAHQDGCSYTFISPHKEFGPDLALEEIKKLEPSASVSIEHYRQLHWERAIPVYNQERALAIQEARVLLQESNGIVLFGNYVDGISIREMVSGAKSFAAGLA